MKKNKRKLRDTCSLCPALVWQYDEDGKAYCETHARWKHVEIERVRHPLDEYRGPSALPHRVERATKIIIGIIQRIGYAEAFWVAESLAFEPYVQWWDERVVIRLSDLQLVAFAAAMRAHRETIYPNRSKHARKETQPKRKKKKEYAPLRLA